MVYTMLRLIDWVKAWIKPHWLLFYHLKICNGSKKNDILLRSSRKCSSICSSRFKTSSRSCRLFTLDIKDHTWKLRTIIFKIRKINRINRSHRWYDIHFFFWNLLHPRAKIPEVQAQAKETDQDFARKPNHRSISHKKMKHWSLQWKHQCVICWKY